MCLFINVATKRCNIVMSVIKRKLRKRTFLYAKLGTEQIYLGPENNPDPEKVHKAIDYVRKRIGHYEGLLENLERLTPGPQEERRRPEDTLPETSPEFHRGGPNEVTSLLDKSLIIDEEAHSHLVLPGQTQAAVMRQRVAHPEVRLHVGRPYLSLTDSIKATAPKHSDFFTVAPLETVLIPTLERVDLPADTVALIVPLTSLPFRGSSTTAKLIPPGFKGRLSIEFQNISKKPVDVYYGQEFWAVIFLKTKGTVLQRDVRYRGPPTTSTTPTVRKHK